MRWLWLPALLMTALAGCSSPKSAEKAESSKAAPPAKPPEEYSVRFETTKGPFTMKVVRAWAPKGADRFYELLQNGFYEGARFYRVRPKFVAQFGISTDPKRNELWRQLKLADDPVKQSNRRGFVSFATQGPGSRTTQVFINLADNSKALDKTGFAPFAEVTEGMDVVDQLFSGYGEVQSLGGPGPDPVRIETQGDEYVQRSYPKLDAIQKAEVIL